MLAYDQPTAHPTADAKMAMQPERSRSPQAAGFNLVEMAALLWRRLAWIVAVALMCAVLALVIGKSLTPKYTATTQLYVDPRELQLVDRELAPRTQDATSVSMIAESQARLVTSNSVLFRVIDSAKLETDPEFGGGQAGGLFSSLMGFFSSGAKSGAASSARLAALEALYRHITVKRSDRTFIVDVDVWSYDPAKAAMLANAVAAAYLAQAIEVQSSSARRATTELSGRLKELEQRLRASENRVAAYKAENNFVGTQDTLVSDQQLSEVNGRLGSARAATLDAQARYDQITAGIAASADGGATSEALRSPTLASLRGQYAEARRRQAELANDFGSRHPAIRSIETQVADLKKNINEEVTRFAQSARNDLTRAREYENSLVRALDALKRQSVDMSQASVRLRELERDVEANRAVYQSFLKRSRETEEQETLTTSNARIVGEANVPRTRSFPPSMLSLMMLGFIFGALASAALIVLVDQLKSKPAMTPTPAPVRERETVVVAPVAPVAAAPVAEPAAKPAVAAPPAAVAPVVGEPAVVQVETPAPVVAPEQSDVQEQPYIQQPYIQQPWVPAPELQPAAPKPVLALMDKPLITRLGEADAYRRNADTPRHGVIDANRMGWPTLRIGGSPGPFAEAMREIRVAAARRSSSHQAPVLALIAQGRTEDRSIAALNVALAAAHDGIDVLLIDADFSHGELSRRLKALGVQGAPGDVQVSASGLCAPVETINRVTLLPISRQADPAIMSEAVRMIVEDARASDECGLIILDGPAAPFAAWDRSLLDVTDGLLAVLPASLDINQAMENLLAALNGAERKLLGVVLNELDGAHEVQEREYA